MERADEDDATFDAEHLAAIAKRVRHLRNMHGLTQEQLALDTNYSVRTIKNVEAGRKVSIDTYNAIAVIFGTAAKELLTFKRRREMGQLELFADHVVTSYSNDMSGKIQRGGNIDKLMRLNKILVEKIDRQYSGYDNRLSATFTAMGLYLKYELDDYLDQMVDFGFKWEQALCLTHMYFLEVIKLYTMKVEPHNVPHMIDFYVSQVNLTFEEYKPFG
ncbi:helix-turn-helix transcriptional regulator [Xanthobacter sp. V4C-4]|uniref:helix-turn-helix domain-containing protein n=1 Tax=Xanthobacter cornucopiae TaxID=3119924 RepID=UPI0037270D01